MVVLSSACVCDRDPRRHSRGNEACPVHDINSGDYTGPERLKPWALSIECEHYWAGKHSVTAKLSIHIAFTLGLGGCAQICMMQCVIAKEKISMVITCAVILIMGFDHDHRSV